MEFSCARFKPASRQIQSHCAGEKLGHYQGKPDFSNNPWGPTREPNYPDLDQDKNRTIFVL